MYFEPTIYLFMFLFHFNNLYLHYLHLLFRKSNTYVTFFFEWKTQVMQISKCQPQIWNTLETSVTSASVYWHAFRNSYGEQIIPRRSVWGASSLSAWSRAGWGKRPWWSSGARWWLSGSRSLIVKCSGPKNSAGPSGSSRPPRHRPQPPPPHVCRGRAGGSDPRLSRNPSCTAKERKYFIT